jgi:hypothetical protein
MEVKSFDQIYGDMRNHIIARQDKLTDFNDGDVLTSQVEAMARELAMLYVRCRVGYSSFLRSLPYSVFGFRMKDGVKASTRVVLSRSKPFSYETPIPAGTIIAAGGLRFLTSEAGAVLSGEKDSAPLPAIAQDAGDKYNIGVGTIKTILSTLPADIVAVNNPEPAQGGKNAEDWASYMDRFADYIIGLQRTNSSGLVSALTGGHLIRSMSIEEHFPPLDGIWNMTFYLEDGSGSMTPEALAEAKNIIDGSVIKNIGSYRAPGVNARYMTPDIVPVALCITVEAERDIAVEVDVSVVATEVVEIVRKYINGLKIGIPVLIFDLNAVLKRLSCISNAKITCPENDIIVSTNQIARFENCAVTVVAKDE